MVWLVAILSMILVIVDNSPITEGINGGLINLAILLGAIIISRLEEIRDGLDKRR
jgi:hypothetical protein